MATKAAPGPAPAARGPTHAPAAPRPAPGLVERARLFELLDGGAPGAVTLVSAPAGSGKTMLLSSWLADGRRSEAVAWVAVERDETDPTRFWASVIGALRGSGAVPAADPLATLAPAPGGQQEFVERLLEGLGSLPGTVLLVLDDLHELRSDEALRGLERLLERAPAQLRTVIASRRDPKLGLHRLRLAGQLTEIRAAELSFTAAEAGELMAGAGVEVADADLARLHERTEGWAAGLRLAAMSLARHREPARFVAEFSGSERTVADYLLAEVLASQPDEVRHLLLRTCVLERVNGPLADLLTGRPDGTRLLHELDEGGALVVAVDVARSWFRYHHLLADLLRLELRREAPDEIPRLHRLAAGWHAEHGAPVDAIRHAELAEDWELAAELLGRHWAPLLLDGEEATLLRLLSGLPHGLAESDAELAAIAAAGRLAESRWSDADGLMASAESAIAGVAPERRARAATALATVQLLRARRLGDLGAVADVDSAAWGDGVGSTELKALALMNLGLTESWALRLTDAEEHLQKGLALGREAGRAYVEVGCLGGLGVVAYMAGHLGESERLFREAIAVADRVGWARHPILAVSYVTLGTVLLDRGAPAEAEPWLDRADPILDHAPEPAASMALRHAQGMLAFSRGRFEDALAAWGEGERIAGTLRAPHFLGPVARQWRLRSRLRLGDPEPARAALAEAQASGDPLGAEWFNLDALLRLAAGDADGAASAVAPVLAGDALILHVNREIEALLLDGLARMELGETDAAERSVERALELSEPGRVWIVQTVPGVRELLEAHPLHRTAHAAHLKALLDQLAGVEPAPAGDGVAAPSEPLSERELAVLRFLPTNLSAAEIGNELILSVHTVKTHMRKLYAKLDVHTRAEAVQRGRALGLLGPPRSG